MAHFLFVWHSLIILEIDGRFLSGFGTPHLYGTPNLFRTLHIFTYPLKIYEPLSETSRRVRDGVTQMLF